MDLYYKYTIKFFSILLLTGVSIKFLYISNILQYIITVTSFVTTEFYKEIIFILLLGLLIGIFNIKLFLYTILEILILFIYSILLIYSPRMLILANIAFIGGMIGGYIGNWYYQKKQHKADIINLNKNLI